MTNLFKKYNIDMYMYCKEKGIDCRDIHTHYTCETDLEKELIEYSNNDKTVVSAKDELFIKADEQSLFIGNDYIEINTNSNKEFSLQMQSTDFKYLKLV